MRYISQEEALLTMTNEMGANPVEFAGQNPFQAEIEVMLNASYANSDSLHVLSEQLRQDNRVFDIAYLDDQIDDVNRNIQRISIILLALSVLLLIVSYSLISSSVKLGVYAHRFTIHTMKLVGRDGRSSAGRSCDVASSSVWWHQCWHAPRWGPLSTVFTAISQALWR